MISVKGLGYLFPFILALGALAGNLAGGLWTYTGITLIFILHPLFDLLLRKQKTYVTINTFYYDFLIWLTPAFLIFYLVLNLWTIQKYNSLELVGALLSLGSIMGVIGITVAHELVHRTNKLEKFLGFFLLSMVNFTHWGAEHVEGHHKWVGTQFDSATARMNEALYAFWFRDYFMGLYNNFKNEIAHKSFLQNRYLIYGLGKAAWISAFLYFGNTKILLLWFLQSGIAIILLLTVDYVEHYGLFRKFSDGKFEPVKAEHSWDSYTPITNFALFKLGYHAHHHLKPRVPYPELAEQPQARLMPYGYSTMIWLALLPPLFFKYMNQRV